MDTATMRQRLGELALKMKTAKGKELDRLVAEVDTIIGFDNGDEDYEKAKAAVRRRQGLRDA